LRAEGSVTQMNIGQWKINFPELLLRTSVQNNPNNNNRRKQTYETNH